MSMEIYNTLSQRTEPFVPIEEGKVKMYVCGPTVYNLIHIGNARPICVSGVPGVSGDICPELYRYRR